MCIHIRYAYINQEKKWKSSHISNHFHASPSECCWACMLHTSCSLLLSVSKTPHWSSLGLTIMLKVTLRVFVKWGGESSPQTSKLLWGFSDFLLAGFSNHWVKNENLRTYTGWWQSTKNVLKIVLFHYQVRYDKTLVQTTHLYHFLCYRPVQTRRRGHLSWQKKAWSPPSSTSTRNSQTLTSEEAL